MSECRTRYRLIRRLQRLREQSPEEPVARRPDAHAGMPSHGEASVAPGLDVGEIVDADRLARDVARYLSTVDLFRAEGAGPRWASEHTPPEWWVTEWTVHH